MAYLLDTNVLSELQKPRPNQSVMAWFEAHTTADLYLSPLSIGEIQHGIDRLRPRDPVRAARIEHWMLGIIAAYSDRIAPVSVEAAREWGRMHIKRTLPIVDSLIAATAKVNGWTLVTRNRKDVEDTGVTVLNPFEWPSG